MLQKKFGQRGFTIIELLIVIIVVGILGMLIFSTFAGIQSRARDTERQTDITAIATQLEVYFKANSSYPAFSQINDAVKVQQVLPSLDLRLLEAPGKSFSLQGAVAGNVDQYGYVAFPANCTGAADNPCTSFILSYFKESLGSGESNPITKNSQN